MEFLIAKHHKGDGSEYVESANMDNVRFARYYPELKRMILYWTETDYTIVHDAPEELVEAVVGKDFYNE